MDRERLRRLAIVSSLALIAFIIRATSLDAQSLWRDEVDSLRFATFPWSRMLANFTHPGWNGPLYFLLLRGWIALTGTSEYAMRFFSLIFGVLCVPLIYVLGRRLFNSIAGSFAALLMATSPYMVWYSQEVRMYTLVPALTMLAIYALRRALEGGGQRWWAIQVAATTLAFYCHILAALLILVQVLLCLIWWPLTRKRWLGASISLAFLTLPYIPLGHWQIPLAFKERETGFPYHTLGEMSEILLNGWSSGIAGRGMPWSTLIMASTAAWGLLTAWPIARRFSPLNREATGDGKNRTPNTLALLCWLIVPLLVVWLISLRQPIFTDRYLTWSAPPFYLLVALGATSLPWPGLLLVIAILVTNGVNLRHQAIDTIKSDFRAAAAYVATYQEPKNRVETQAPPERPTETYRFKYYLPLVAGGSTNELIIFQIPYGRYTFDYYFPEENYSWAEGLYTNHRAPDGSYLKSKEEVAWHMRELVAGHDTVWLVATETSMWDERGLVQAWLEENAQLVTEAHFKRVDVYHYKLKEG